MDRPRGPGLPAWTGHKGLGYRRRHSFWRETNGGFVTASKPNFSGRFEVKRLSHFVTNKRITSYKSQSYARASWRIVTRENDDSKHQRGMGKDSPCGTPHAFAGAGTGHHARPCWRWRAILRQTSTAIPACSGDFLVRRCHPSAGQVPASHSKQEHTAQAADRVPTTRVVPIPLEPQDEKNKGRDEIQQP